MRTLPRHGRGFTLVEMLGVIGVVLLLFRVLTPPGWRRIGDAGSLS